jgi:hypothetical protein
VVSALRRGVEHVRDVPKNNVAVADIFVVEKTDAVDSEGPRAELFGLMVKPHSHIDARETIRVAVFFGSTVPICKRKL